MCGSISSAACSSTQGSYNGHLFDCAIGSEGGTCVESEISQSVVFLGDGTGLDALTEAENNDLWNSTITFWPRKYISDMAQYQVSGDNIKYHWIIFGSTIWAEDSCDGGDASDIPWKNQFTMSSQLISERGNSSKTTIDVISNKMANFAANSADYVLNLFEIERSSFRNYCGGDASDIICSYISCDACSITQGSCSYKDYFLAYLFVSKGCTCAELEISQSVVFLVDGTGLDALTEAENSDLWHFTLTFCPRKYISNIAQYQVSGDNVKYHWITFGSTIWAEYSYDGGDASDIPWKNQFTMPSELIAERGNVDFCVAYDRALELFEMDGESSKTIVYVMYNEVDNFACDLADYDINLFQIGWGDIPDTDGNFGDSGMYH